MSKKLTKLELAAALALSVDQVSRCAVRGMPTNSVAAAQRWRERNVAAKASRNGALLAARIRLAQATAERLEQKRLAIDKRLIEAAEVRSVLVHLRGRFRARLTDAEQRLRDAYPDLPPAVCTFIRGAHENALALLDPDIALKQVTEH